ncbi:MAG: CvpA family protein [Candidatus Cloacimonetes bacterium]|nr:CvpA family protein [Candidatus Cloacimonadota bacterium]
MNILDIILGVILLFFFINGLRKGFVASFIHLLGLILAVILVAKTGQIVKEGLITQFGLNETFALIIAYVLIFLIIMIVTRIAVKLVQRIVEFLNLMWLNRLLGGVFSCLCGVVIIAIIILLLNLLPFQKEIRDFTDQSRIVSTIRIQVEKLENQYSGTKKIKQTLQQTIDEQVEKTDKLKGLINP